MATFPTIYTDNIGAYKPLLDANFQGYGVNPMSRGAAVGVDIDPTILFTSGSTGPEVDRLTGSRVSQSGINEILKIYGITQVDNPFNAPQNGINNFLANLFSKPSDGGNNLITSGEGGNSYFSIIDIGGNNEGGSWDIPLWVWLLLIAFLLFAGYTAYRIYLK
jgi:hypothetical protein